MTYPSLGMELMVTLLLQAHLMLKALVKLSLSLLMTVLLNFITIMSRSLKQLLLV